MKIADIIKESIEVKQKLLADTQALEAVNEAAEMLLKTYRNNGKVLLCGNGGSASDAQHIAAELTGRFKMERRPLYAEALHCNTSYLTAVANDYGFNEIYARIIASNSISGDVLIALSTSGNSENIVKACMEAKAKGLLVVGLTGKTGGRMLTLCDTLIRIPSTDTARIQECHILLGHIICEIIEQRLFSK